MEVENLQSFWGGLPHCHGLLRVLYREIWSNSFFFGKVRMKTDHKAPEESGYPLADNGELVEVWGHGSDLSK